MANLFQTNDWFLILNKGVQSMSPPQDLALKYETTSNNHEVKMALYSPQNIEDGFLWKVIETDKPGLYRIVNKAAGVSENLSVNLTLTVFPRIPEYLQMDSTPFSWSITGAQIDRVSLITNDTIPRFKLKFLSQTNSLFLDPYTYDSSWLQWEFKVV